jgi:hypothetical protein
MTDNVNAGSAAGKITGRFDVAYSIDLPGYAPALTTVILIDGYTTHDDIPQIIALSRGVKASDIRIIVVTSVEERIN